MTWTPPPVQPPPPPPPRHSGLSRRRFILGAGALGAAAAASGVLAAVRPWDHAATASTGGPGGGPLVLITLYGGNDGLNTVIPYADPAYLSLRPSLGYQPSQVLPLAEGLGLNPKLPGLQALWKSGHLAVVRGVGYPNPNLSHFASMAIWQTANVTDGTGPGWLGRWLDSVGDGPERAISVGTSLPPVLRGQKESAAAVTGPTVKLPGDAAFLQAYTAMQAPSAGRAGVAAEVASSGADLLAVRQRLAGLSGPSSASAAGAGTGTGTGTDLTTALGVVSDLILAGCAAQIYQVSLSSFDTHAGEKADHERLLTDLDGAVTAFFRALGASRRGAGVVLMTYSEFGRRPAENASGGTDHGTAAPLFVIGPTVRGGRFYGEEPSLTQLDPNGDPAHTVDFRQVYATVLDRVIGADPEPVLGGRFQTLPFV